jgi:Phasin protein
MSEHQSGPFQGTGGLPNMMSPELTERVKESGEAMAAIQKEWMQMIEQSYRDWMGALTNSAAQHSELITKMKDAKSAPEAAAAYQEWAGRQMEIYTNQGRKAMENGQKMMTAWTRMLGDRKGGLSS